MDTTKDTAPPVTRETVTQKALRLYPERIVEPLGHGRYSVEGSGGHFYEVDLGIGGGHESCPCLATKPCYHISLATIHRAKAKAKARRAKAERTAARASRASLAASL
jgi:hypothetical protein